MMQVKDCCSEALGVTWRVLDDLLASVNLLAVCSGSCTSSSPKQSTSYRIRPQHEPWKRPQLQNLVSPFDIAACFFSAGDGDHIVGRADVRGRGGGPLNQGSDIRIYCF